MQNTFLSLRSTFTFTLLRIKVWTSWGSSLLPVTGVCVCVCACSHIQVLSHHSCVWQVFVLGMSTEFCQRLLVSLDMILWYFDPINMVNCINIFLNIESFSFVIHGSIFHFPFQFFSFYLVEILLYLLFKNDFEVFLDFLCSKQLM